MADLRLLALTHLIAAASFVFPFDYIEDHGGWFELIVTVGNDGFAFVLFVRDCEGVDPELLAMCRAHAGR